MIGNFFVEQEPFWWELKREVEEEGEEDRGAEREFMATTIAV
jgi:hypothetical protein